MTRPWWEESLGPDERRALDPGPGDLDPRPDVLVVGGGVVGLGTAVMCRRAGLGRVQVIERGTLACGPSGSAAGGLSPGMYAIARPGAFERLASESLALYRELDADWDGALGLRDMDWLVVSSDRIPPDSIDVPGCTIVDPGEARRIEPRLGGDVGGAISIPLQAWVDPRRVAIELARRAGRVATGVRMTEMRGAGGNVVSVVTTAGGISPGAVVLATGAAPGGRAVKGHLLVTDPAPDPPRVAVASTIIVIPLPDGRLLAGGTFDHGDDEPAVRDEIVEGIRAETARLLPATAGLGVERAWCCFRPATPDEMPVIDRVSGRDNAWVSVGHYRTGLLLAPGAGRALATWISLGAPPSGIEPFAASRFA